ATSTGVVLDTRPMTGSFGADIHGLDLSQALDGATTAAIEAAFADHSVLAFRDQQLTVDQLEAFALQFGSFGDTPFITPLDDHPNVLAVVREADEAGALFGGSWHSDWSFQHAPPSATILYGHEVPPAGGDTVFTNQYLAYETLSDGMKRMLEGLNAIHSAQRSYGPQGVFGRPDPKAAMHIQGGEEALVRQTHPIVRTHPVTGRKLLFINDVYTIGIEDMNVPESKALLGYLLEHSKQVSFLCRVRWQPGTLTMWDNRCVQHHAINDYPGQRREMYRVTLAGEVPV
ncbi:MAG: TauD/TfdA family dioxygenase, partial [Acidimicrobiales bacterium]|nr:TauD/TfdA family dioxygenase [Acidimicrobiales bacterium]